MGSELSDIVRDMFAQLDSGNTEALRGLMDDDAEGIDELSRRWVRGAAELGHYISTTLAAVKDIRSQIRDVSERSWGDTGIVTCWLDQAYSHEGQTANLTAPTSVVLRRRDDAWRITLIHTIPLPEPG
jgi:ketosteroid isomerase-like protein